MAEYINPFTQERKELTDEQKEFMKHVNAHAATLYDQISMAGKIGDPRNLASAKTYLEIAVMLANKAICMGQA